MTKKDNKTIALFFCVIVFIIITVFTTQNKIFKDLVQLVRIYKDGKHLILFQNNAELRPTGGFLGSFAVIDTKNFLIKKIYFESNIYKRDNEFVYKNNYIPKDKVLKNFVPNNKLAMRDSNWSVDFSKAAFEVAWFYEHEGGEKVDTITGINTEFFKNILKIIGPIKMVKYDIEVDSTNFNELIQNEIENKYQLSKDNYAVSEPKSIIYEMMPIVFSRIKSVNNLTKIIKLIPESLSGKEILLASTNPKFQKVILDKNWGGSIKDNESIYLYINNANLGSNKSSIYIKEDIVLNIKEDVEGNTFSLLEFYRSFPKVIDCRSNINFTQIIIPNNSELISVFHNDQDIFNGIEFTDLYDHKSIRLWTNIECEKSDKYQFMYKISKEIISSNKIIIQKQSGAINQYLKVYYKDQLLFDGNFIEDIAIDLPIST